MVIWSKNAKVQLRKAFNYISQDSVQNAEKVRDEIIELALDLPNQSEKYPLDKY